MKRIELDAYRMVDQEALHPYMMEVFHLEPYGHNLDGLFDVLVEYSENVQLVLTKSTLQLLLAHDYAYRAFIVISQACGANPHLSMRFTK